MTTLSSRDKRRTVGALTYFIRKLIADTSFDYIVPVERKGMALIRAVCGSVDDFSWTKVIGLETLQAQTPPEGRKRLLVLDDSVWRGDTVRKTVEAIERAWPTAHVTVAAFMLHRRAPADTVHHAYYVGLDDARYRECWSTVVEFLQETGSLLLDTEHLEMRARLRCRPGDLADALAGWGHVVRYAASSNRVNLTVFQHAEELCDVLEPVSPPHTDLRAAVCKIRVVSQPRAPHDLSLIPICYPTLVHPAEASYEHPHMSWTRRVRGSTRVFQSVGLALSAALLGDAIARVENVLGDQVALEFPPGSLDHLMTVLPEVSIPELTHEVERSRDGSFSRAAKVGHTDDPGQDALLTLAQEILLRCFDRHEWDPAPFLRRLTLSEVLGVGREMGHTEARASAALDILIDGARIIPRTIWEIKGNAYSMSRVFTPDGELVSRDIVRQALLAGRGLPRLRTVPT